MFNKFGIERIYLSMRKVIYDKPIANTLLNNEKLKHFPLRFGIRQGCPLSLLLFYVVVVVLARTNQARKRY